MKRILVITIVLVVGVILLIHILPYPSRLLTQPFKEALEEKLKQDIPYSFSLGDIRLLFFNRVTIEDVRIGDSSGTQGIYCEISRVSVSFNLISLITNPENIGRALKGETGTWIVN